MPEPARRQRGIFSRGTASFATAEGRRAHQAEIDAAISTWTGRQDVFGAEARLQGEKVPASAVRTMHQLYQDPQLLHREYLLTRRTPTTAKQRSKAHASSCPALRSQVGGSAATLGRDNQYVPEKILGSSEEKIIQLVSAEVLE